MKILYYFGTNLNRCGHYIWRLRSSLMQEERDITVPFNPESYPVKPVYLGDAEFHVVYGWSIFAIAGSPGDRRPGSKCVFFINEVITEDEMIRVITENVGAMRIINACPFNVKQIPKSV